MGLNSYRVLFLRRWLNRLLDMSRLGLASAIFLSLIIALIRFFPSTSPAGLSRQTIIAAVVLAILGIAARKGRYLSTLVRDITHDLKRSIYLAVRSQTPLGGAVIAPSTVKVIIDRHFLSISTNLNDAQETLVRSLRETIAKLHSCTIIVEGHSGSGKTATMILLLDRLLHGAKTAQTYPDTYYFDMAAGSKEITAFLYCCTNASLRDALVVLDNFHLVQPNDLERITAYALDQHNAPWGALLVLTQPRRFMTLSPSMDTTLFEHARKSGCLYHLKPPSRRKLRSFYLNDAKEPLYGEMEHILDTLGVSHSEGLRWVVYANVRRVATMAMQESENVLRDLMQLSVSKQTEGQSYDLDLIHALAIIVALSIHRGAFSEQELNRALDIARGPRSLFNTSRRRLRIIIYRLQGIGFLVKAIARERVYVFHQTLSEHFRDHFSDFPQFANVFVPVCRFLTNSLSENKPTLRWLYNVEIGDENAVIGTFDIALAEGAYMPMYQALERGIRHPMSPHWETTIDNLAYLRGLLSERIGALEEARRFFREFHEKQVQCTDSWIRSGISLVEAEHGPDSLAFLESIERCPVVSSLYRTSAAYWIVHIKAHGGEFDIDTLDQLIRELEVSWNNARHANPTDAMHLARRLIFDRARFHYLIGSGEYSVIDQLQERPLTLELEKLHHSFSAFKRKFFEAHLLHYDAMFALGFLGEVSTELDQDLVPEGKERDIDWLINKSIQCYEAAMESFKIFGDKTADYVRGRWIEVRLAANDADLDRIGIDLHEYTEFMRLTGVPDLVPYPLIYHFKLAFLNAIASLNHPNPEVGTAEFDSKIRLSLYYIEQAKQAFEHVNNLYLIDLCQLFSVFIQFVIQKDKQVFEDALIRLRANAQKLGYIRYLRAIDHVLTSTTTPLSKVRDCIRFFPFVHQ